MTTWPPLKNLQRKYQSVWPMLTLRVTNSKSNGSPSSLFKKRSITLRRKSKILRKRYRQLPTKKESTTQTLRIFIFPKLLLSFNLRDTKAALLQLPFTPSILNLLLLRRTVPLKFGSSKLAIFNALSKDIPVFID